MRFSTLLYFFSSKVFGHQNPGSGLDPDSFEMLDPYPDPDSMNPNPKLWYFANPQSYRLMSLVVKKNAEDLFVNWLKEIVELLVSAGAEVNCRDKDLMTPLHAAAAATGRRLVEFRAKRF